MILTEKFLLPPNLDDAERQAIVDKRVRKCHGVNGHVVAVLPGESGWVQQLGNKDGAVYFGVVERRFNSPSLPQRNHRRKSW